MLLGEAPRDSEAVGEGVPLPVGVAEGVPVGVWLGDAPMDKELVGVAVLESVTVSGLQPPKLHCACA